LVVKPTSEGSSIGVSICENLEEISKGLSAAFELGGEVLIEEYVKGREVTCCVIGTASLETLPLIEIRPRQGRFFDYGAKYTSGATDEICPAPIPPDIAKRAAGYALAAHRALGCSVWSRTDMIIRDEEILVLETNTIPGMTENSLFPLAAKAAGLTFASLVDRLVALSLEA
jgi:D-alanine-D-alanine ligase